MKIIVCFCTRRKLEDSEISYTVSNTYHCQCQPNRQCDFSVVPCQEDTLFKRVLVRAILLMLQTFEYCENCCRRRYILNFVADKICVEKVPETIERKMVKIEDYLKNIKNEPFFLFL